MDDGADWTQVGVSFQVTQIRQDGGLAVPKDACKPCEHNMRLDNKVCKGSPLLSIQSAS